jgi:hypothetical protein
LRIYPEFFAVRRVGPAMDVTAGDQGLDTFRWIHAIASSAVPVQQVLLNSGRAGHHLHFYASGNAPSALGP